MDTARQVVRWSIPGWTLIFVASTLQLITSLTWSGTPQALLASGTLNLISPAMVALLVTSGIPLGFLVYQVYYYLYGQYFPFSIVNRDRGGEILAALPLTIAEELKELAGSVSDTDNMTETSTLIGYPVVRLIPGARNQRGRAQYRLRVHTNWETIRFLVHVICLRNKSPEVRAEVTNLADIYHAIGASRIGLIAAALVHMGYNLVAKAHLLQVAPLKVVASILLPQFGVALLLFALESTRRQTLNSLQMFLAQSVRFFTAPRYSTCQLWAPSEEPMNPAVPASEISKRGE